MTRRLCCTAYTVYSFVNDTTRITPDRSYLRAVNGFIMSMLSNVKLYQTSEESRSGSPSFSLSHQTSTAQGSRQPTILQRLLAGNGVELEVGILSGNAEQVSRTSIGGKNTYERIRRVLV